jgi:hypothetical protein
MDSRTEITVCFAIINKENTVDILKFLGQLTKTLKKPTAAHGHTVDSLPYIVFDNTDRKPTF